MPRKTIKYLSSVILAGMAVISAITMSSDLAKANNWRDEPFGFNFEGNDYCNTGVEEKEDNSAAYMYCDCCEGFDIGYYATVYGSNGDHNGTVCSNSYLYHDGTQRYQPNWVHGSYSYAYFRAYVNNEVVSYSGVWSPDNFNGYQ